MCRGIANQRGNAALYAILILPVSVTFTVLAVDVSSYQSLRNYAQREADRITLQAAQLLPDVRAASEFVTQSVAALPDLRIAATEDAPLLSVSTSGISLTLEGEVDAAFDFFLSAYADSSQSFTVRERSEAQVVPSDYVLIVSDDRLLRPDSHSAWGDEGAWPASSLFDLVQGPRIEGIEQFPDPETYWVDWWQDWQDGLFQRWHTQTCFNPRYSSVKLSAISLADTVLSVRNNRLALIFTPGNNPELGYSVARPLSFPSSPVVEQGAQARWLGYWEEESYISDEACVLLADAEFNSTDRYEVPEPPAYMGSSSTCDSRIADFAWDDVYFPNGRLSDCYLQKDFSVRDSIYFHAARASRASLDGAGFLAAINEAFLQLVLATEEQVAADGEIRGNAAAQTRKIIVAFTQVLPTQNLAGLEETLTALADSGIELVAVTVPAEGQEAEFQARAMRLEELGGKGVNVLMADSLETLAETIAPRLARLGRSYILKS